LAGRRGPASPLALLVAGSVASLPANVALAEPSLAGPVIVARTSFALTASQELLTWQGRSALVFCRGVRERPGRMSRFKPLTRLNTPISAAQWNAVIQNPDNYQGDIYTISGTVTEYNINSNTLATQESAALVAEDSNGNYFVVEAPASVLGDVQPGDTFTAKVTVLGAEEAQNTVFGGTSEVPDFDASTFTVTS
jgi:hypothetical protein